MDGYNTLSHTHMHIYTRGDFRYKQRRTFHCASCSIAWSRRKILKVLPVLGLQQRLPFINEVFIWRLIFSCLIYLNGFVQGKKREGKRRKITRFEGHIEVRRQRFYRKLRDPNADL